MTKLIENEQGVVAHAAEVPVPRGALLCAMGRAERTVHIAIAKNGAWPCALPGVYSADNKEMKNYSLAAKTKNGFDDYMKRSLSI